MHRGWSVLGLRRAPPLLRGTHDRSREELTFGIHTEDKEVLEVHFKRRAEDENKLLRKEAVMTVWGMAYCT